jgi:hypothetical protein
MKNIFLLLCVITLIYSSCVRSLYPLTEDAKDIVFKKELLGRWKNPKENTEYLIDSITTKLGLNYSVMLVEHKSGNEQPDTSNFIVMLVNIKGKYFLDCIPDINHAAFSAIGEQSRSLIVSTHFIVKVYAIEKEYFSVSAIDKDALAILLQNKNILIRHEDINKDDILFTEKPEMLQQKLLELEKFPSVYKRDSLFRIK